MFLQQGSFYSKTFFELNKYLLFSIIIIIIFKICWSFENYVFHIFLCYLTTRRNIMVRYIKLFWYILFKKQILGLLAVWFVSTGLTRFLLTKFLFNNINKIKYNIINRSTVKDSISLSLSTEMIELIELNIILFGVLFI